MDKRLFTWAQAAWRNGDQRRIERYLSLTRILRAKAKAEKIQQMRR